VYSVTPSSDGTCSLIGSVRRGLTSYSQALVAGIGPKGGFFGAIGSDLRVSAYDIEKFEG